MPSSSTSWPPKQLPTLHRLPHKRFRRYSTQSGFEATAGQWRTHSLAPMAIHVQTGVLANEIVPEVFTEGGTIGFHKSIVTVSTCTDAAAKNTGKNLATRLWNVRTEDGVTGAKVVQEFLNGFAPTIQQAVRICDSVCGCVYVCVCVYLCAPVCASVSAFCICLSVSACVSVSPSVHLCLHLCTCTSLSVHTRLRQLLHAHVTMLLLLLLLLLL